MDRLKILVVDDESRMRKLVRDFLVRNQYEVLEAGDGEEAMEFFFAQKDIALVILDVMMPKMDGWQVCREIRAYSKVPDFSWEWMSIFRNLSVPEFWLRVWKLFCGVRVRRLRRRH